MLEEIIEEVKPEQHYSSTLSEFIYNIPSLILYINEDSIDYHSQKKTGLS